jgi:hypothetical protein
MIYTQYHEYYGTPECGRWKPKGGGEYFVSLGSVIPDVKEIEAIVNSVKSQCEWYSEFGSESYIVSWEIQSDDFLTGFEKDQLEYEGVIRYPAKELVR